MSSLIRHACCCFQYAGTARYRLLLGDRALSAEAIANAFAEDAEAFVETRREYLLYD
mgnify:CR=1